MVFFGLFGMSWGLLFSSRGESVLNVIGLAIGGQLVGGFLAGILFVPVVIVLAVLGIPVKERELIFLCLAALVLTVGPIVGSAHIFSRPDRLRQRGRARPSAGAAGRALASWGRLLWLSYAQMRRLILGLMIFSLALGFLLPAAGPVAWPALTLFLGVFCGVTVCADEQAHGSFRFLGDQRFPLGRVWIVKVGMRFALAVFAAFLLMLPSLVLTIARRIESHSPQETLPPFVGNVLHSTLVGPVVPVGLHLTMWLLYGFTVGHLCGLLFRKSLVAAVVSLGGSVLLVSLWLPSLLGIGLHFWQIAGVPVILLATTWLLVPAWAADRLVARGTFVQLGVALVAVGLWTAGGLWYRVVEVPDVPDQLDMPAFVASLPTTEKNKAGELMRSACARVNSLERSLAERRRNERHQQPDNFWSQLQEVLEHGWSGKTPAVAQWLDAMLQDNWVADLAEVPDLPPGVFENPKLLTIGSHMDKLQSARTLTTVLAVRGLQRQAAGDDAVFVENLRIGLTVSRGLQHDSPTIAALVGRATESVWPSALDRWLENLRGHPEVLEHVLRTLIQYEVQMPDEESLQAEYLIALNTLEQTPEVLLHVSIDNSMKEDAEVQVAALAWLFPWEQERHHRILRVVFQGDNRQRRKAHEWGGVLSQTRLPFGSPGTVPSAGWPGCAVAQLKVALRLYQAETGKPATTLDVLVPRYLPAIPLDPFDGHPFRYRLSRGKRSGCPRHPKRFQVTANLRAEPGPLRADLPARWWSRPPAAMAGMPEQGPPGPPPPTTRFVPKGQGILWSVGVDSHDDGGVQQSLNEFGATFGEDIIYLVPPPRK